ncbi:hypothetical protein FRC00_014428, partial [Tulasnella sp. 408]
MLRWANDTAKKSHPQTTPLRSFKDPAISSGIFFLNLVDSMRPGIVDQSLVINPANEYEEQRQNAKLAISIARKMNALIFLVPEDIVDVRPRLTSTTTTNMELRRLMQDACAKEEPVRKQYMNTVSKHLPAKQDEAAVIALYSSAASESALDDFVAATKEILNLESPKNPLESVAMEILEDVLKRASDEDDGAEELFSLLMNNGRPKEVIIALDEALGNLSHENVSQGEEDNVTKLCLLVHGYSLVLPRMVPRRVKAEETVNSTLTAIRTAANVSFVQSHESQEAEAYFSSTIQLLSNATEWCATDPSSSPDSCK